LDEYLEYKTKLFGELPKEENFAVIEKRGRKEGT